MLAFFVQPRSVVASRCCNHEATQGEVSDCRTTFFGDVEKKDLRTHQQIERFLRSKRSFVQAPMYKV